MLSLLIAFSLSLTGAQATNSGTNGAGTNRRWNPCNEASFEAEFHHVADGVVTLSVSCRVTILGKNGRITKTVKNPICYPLAALSASDRRWIEDMNPTETCLMARKSHPPKNGAVGTLTPKSGFYRIRQIVDRETALVDYICICEDKKDKEKNARREKVTWSFQLRSKIVMSLTNQGEYDSISRNLVQNFGGLPQHDQEKYGVDFKVTRRVKNGESSYFVEDNR